MAILAASPVRARSSLSAEGFNKQARKCGGPSGSPGTFAPRLRRRGKLLHRGARGLSPEAADHDNVACLLTADAGQLFSVVRPREREDLLLLKIRQLSRRAAAQVLTPDVGDAVDGSDVGERASVRFPAQRGPRHVNRRG